MATVQIARGGEVVVDEDNIELVRQYRWYPVSAGLTTYAGACIDGKTAYLHRIIACTPDGMDTDHIDGNGLNNLRSNLRVVSHRMNVARRRTAVGPSGFRGVHITRSKKFSAKIEAEGKRYWLGVYEKAEDAARAYNAKATELFGEYARLNDLEA